MVELLKVGTEFKLTEDGDVVQEWTDNSKLLSGKKGKIVAHTGKSDFRYITSIEGLATQIEVRDKDIILINEDWESIIET